MHIRVGESFTTVLDLSQRDVYADVIEGVPNRRINRGIIESALDGARRRHHLSPHLVPPVERPLPSRAAAPTPDEERTALPKVCCVARVRCHTTNDPDADHSEACLVWFQDEVGAPLPPEVSEHLAATRWADIARDERW